MTEKQALISLLDCTLLHEIYVIVTTLTIHYLAPELTRLKTKSRRKEINVNGGEHRNADRSYY